MIANDSRISGFLTRSGNVATAGLVTDMLKIPEAKHRLGWARQEPVDDVLLSRQRRVDGGDDPAHSPDIPIPIDQNKTCPAQS